MSDALANAAALQDHLVRSLKLGAGGGGPSAAGAGSSSRSRSSSTAFTSAPSRHSSLPPMAPLVMGRPPSGPAEAAALAARDEWVELNPQHAKSLSLAQRRGLVERPADPLCPEAWAAAASAARARGDPTGTCPICRDEFHAEEQLMTSWRASAGAARPPPCPG